MVWFYQTQATKAATASKAAPMPNAALLEAAPVNVPTGEEPVRLGDGLPCVLFGVKAGAFGCPWAGVLAAAGGDGLPLAAGEVMNGCAGMRPTPWVGGPLGGPPSAGACCVMVLNDT